MDGYRGQSVLTGQVVDVPLKIQASKDHVGLNGRRYEIYI